MHKIATIKALLKKHSYLKDAVLFAESAEQFCSILQREIDHYFENRPKAQAYFEERATGRKAFDLLNWQDYGAIRLADMLANEGKPFEDPNLHGKVIKSRPLTHLWKAASEKNEIAGDVILDLAALFDQFAGVDERECPSKELVEEWMSQHPSGCDTEVIERRLENQERIIAVLARELTLNGGSKGKFQFPANASEEEKIELLRSWWNESSFHLSFAIRETELLNEMLDNTLDHDTLSIMQEAESHGLPVFVNPYYLSLLDVHQEEGKRAADLAIRMYIFYSRSLIEEFGEISAWEKEDIVVPGEPNAAGWILPSNNIHRRYPEVAIFIPDTIGRACGGLCSSCQRMYGFQSGDFNFELSNLAPKETWPEKLDRLLEYYENDAQLRDILITGGDALMSSDKSLKQIFDRVLAMVERKREANKGRREKFAEISRIRLGTRLPVYLPQRVTPELIAILHEFREKAVKLGVKQFVIQTHFESAMEVTPEAKEAIKGLLSAGWYVTNQLVFTSAASLRGHTAKLRKVLNDVGVLTYYTFTVKGYKENRYNFATNARAVQEQMEEKAIGVLPEKLWPQVTALTDEPKDLLERLAMMREEHQLPFLATDRNVINLPGLGKSQTFRTVGLTDDGRRILEFNLDHNRSHSPVTAEMDKVIIIESKTIAQYLREIAELGEDITNYRSIYGYSLCETEPLMPIYHYRPYRFAVTKKVTNFEMPSDMM